MEIIFKNIDKTKSIFIADADGEILKNSIILKFSEYYEGNRLYFNNKWLFTEDVHFESKNRIGICRLTYSLGGIGGLHNGYYIRFDIQ